MDTYEAMKFIDEHGIEEFNNLMAEYAQQVDLIFFLNKHLDILGITKNKLATESGLGTSYVSDLFSYKNKKKVSRDYLIMLCFGLKLSVENTNVALKSAGHKELYARNFRDTIIWECIDKKLSLTDTNNILDSKDLEILETRQAKNNK